MINLYINKVSIGLEILKRCLRDTFSLPPKARAVYNSMKSIKAICLDTNIRFTFLLHMLWFSAHEAAELGLWELGCFQVYIPVYLSNKYILITL